MGTAKYKVADNKTISTNPRVQEFRTPTSHYFRFNECRNGKTLFDERVHVSAVRSRFQACKAAIAMYEELCKKHNLEAR